MDKSLADFLTPEQKKVLDYFKENPDQTWMQAGEALGMDCVDVLNMAIGLELTFWLETEKDPSNLMRFRVRRTGGGRDLDSIATG